MDDLIFNIVDAYSAWYYSHNVEESGEGWYLLGFQSEEQYDEMIDKIVYNTDLSRSYLHFILAVRDGFHDTVIGIFEDFKETLEYIQKCNRDDPFEVEAAFNALTEQAHGTGDLFSDYAEDPEEIADFRELSIQERIDQHFDGDVSDYNGFMQELLDRAITTLENIIYSDYVKEILKQANN